MIKGDINEMVTSESLVNENFIEVQKEELNKSIDEFDNIKKEDDKKKEDRPDENKV